jgi:molecular chaperone GrpE
MASEDQDGFDEAVAVKGSGEPERTEVPMVASADDCPPDVSFVVPATVVEAIATDDLAVISETEASSPLAQAIETLAATLGKRLDGLQSAFDREIRAEATREKVVDRLHAELQEYKNDLLLNVLRPVFVDLIQLHDDIGKIVAAQAEPGDEAAKLLGLMRGFQQGIEDILYRQGVEPFEADDAVFDPRRQRAFSTVPTDDPALGKTVAARIRKGFRLGDKVVRPEIVSVFALKR